MIELIIITTTSVIRLGSVLVVNVAGERHKRMYFVRLPSLVAVLMRSKITTQEHCARVKMTCELLVGMARKRRHLRRVRRRLDESFRVRRRVLHNALMWCRCGVVRVQHVQHVYVNKTMSNNTHETRAHAWGSNTARRNRTQSQ